MQTTGNPSALIPPGFDIGHAHNIFLQTALDLGLPGMLAYVAIWAVTAVLLVQTWRRTPDRLARALVAGIGAGLVACLVFGITDAIALGAKPSVFFWATLAAVVLLWRQTRKFEWEGSESRAEW